MDNCEIIETCLCCCKDVELLMDLEHQPLANNFHDKNSEYDVYPLRLMVCKNCYHCQLSHSANPSILFKNYKYVSGTTKTGLYFFKQNAEYIMKHKTNSSTKLSRFFSEFFSHVKYESRYL